MLTDANACDLKRLPSAKGIWAPCLMYCEREDLFYAIYGVMNSMNARCFDIDNGEKTDHRAPDRLLRRKTADFDFFLYRGLEPEEPFGEEQ